jgi:hypothetical protein
MRAFTDVVPTTIQTNLLATTIKTTHHLGCRANGGK